MRCEEKTENKKKFCNLIVCDNKKCEFLLIFFFIRTNSYYYCQFFLLRILFYCFYQDLVLLQKTLARCYVVIFMNHQIITWIIFSINDVMEDYMELIFIGHITSIDNIKFFQWIKWFCARNFHRFYDTMNAKLINSIVFPSGTIYEEKLGDILTS